MAPNMKDCRHSHHHPGSNGRGEMHSYNHFWSRAQEGGGGVRRVGDKFYQNDEATTSEKPNSKPVNCKCPTLHISSSIYIYSYVQYEKTIQDEKLSL